MKASLLNFYLRRSRLRDHKLATFLIQASNSSIIIGKNKQIIKISILSNKKLNHMFLQLEMRLFLCYKAYSILNLYIALVCEVHF
jgi:hypothetical protein